MWNAASIAIVAIISLILINHYTGIMNSFTSILTEKFSTYIGGGNIHQSLYGQSGVITRRMNVIPNSPVTQIIYFFNRNCPFCKEFMPIWNDMANKYAKYFQFLDIDCQDQSGKKWCDKYQVESVPYIISRNSGVMITSEFDGERTLKNFELWIQKQIK